MQHSSKKDLIIAMILGGLGGAAVYQLLQGSTPQHQIIGGLGVVLVGIVFWLGIRKDKANAKK